MCRSRNPNCKTDVHTCMKILVCVITHSCSAILYILHLPDLSFHMSLYGMAVREAMQGISEGTTSPTLTLKKTTHGCCNTALLWRKGHFLIFVSPAAEPQNLLNRNIHIFVITCEEKKKKNPNCSSAIMIIP